ncbi:hypothetical protein EA462_02950 [Natrarchaeobius halalkaliphilus]|uniref:DUF8147 domain-containing protein n=1 Tax=Natrarchaeobius halalkaliphilus TaxID=1679091 RepID=A0A3N6MGS3_9EURY|nr:hypothetical protein [Natrarchaeobius halalkaliphilus]RQG93176.1 hypothetical protein EA462_02950 [Natrarchaeobius halalkaliphilus]
MSVKTGTIALVAGLAAFFGVGIGVTAITEHWIDFPLLLGLLAGTLSGLVATIAVTVGLESDVSAGRRRTAGIVTGFGGGFVCGLLIGAAAEPIGTVGSIGVGAGVGLLVAGGYAVSPFGSR